MKDEYISIKNELISCHDKQNSINFGIISLVIAILTFSIVLYEQTKDIFLEGDVYATRLNILLVMMRILAYILPLTILSFLSMKIERNYKQALSMSIYLQIMYEYPSSKKEAFSWERDRQLLLTEQGELTKWYEKIFAFLNKTFINLEFYVLASFVSMLQTVLVIIEFYEIWYLIVGINFIYCILYGFIPFCLLTLFQFIIIHNTSTERLKKRYVETMKSKVVQIALDKNVIDLSQKQECLNFVKV